MKRAVLLWLFAAALAAGCDDKPKELRLISVPPPGKVGTLDDHSVRLSKGVALGIECIDPEDTLRSCGRLNARSSNGNVARAFGADTDQLAGTWVPGRRSQVTERRSVFVVAGLAPGRAQIEIQTSNGIETLDVTVE